MKLFSAIILIFFAATAPAKECPNKKTNSKLFCYYSKIEDVNPCLCTHVILPANVDAKTIDGLKEKMTGTKLLITASAFNEVLVDLIKSSKIDGLEINLKKLSSKNDIGDFISTVRSKLGSNLYLAVAVPSKTEILAKYYDFKALSKNADAFILQTSFLGASQNVTFHPSRLSGLWDMQNTDSVVDLVSGLGAPLSKVVITAPVQAFEFRLQSEEHTAPGSPALEVSSITRLELCEKMSSGSNWTLERDQDQAGPYIFRKDQWIAFDDAISMDIKAKYARVRGLAGLALKDLSQDGGEKCGGGLLEAAFNGLSKQARAPRGAVLHSLEREILDIPVRPLDTIQVSPFRISRVIDVEGNIHDIRKDTRTEFECARQGYYVHPRSCGRFYRCVKFDQLVNDFNVFEFDCPAGLVFDSRVEVCVWPGSLPYSSSCAGSSEIAPVPKQRFVCPEHEGYYADPENCRWFFACLDHGESSLKAYEFRCPFGLVYDEENLLCTWPWLVPRCGVYGFEHETVEYYGGGGGVLSNFHRLDTYDGLGALGTIQLGGLSGTLVQPANKVYSTSNTGFGQGYGTYVSSGNAGYAHGGGSSVGFGQGYGTYISSGNAGYAHGGGSSAVFGSGSGFGQGYGTYISSGNAGYAHGGGSSAAFENGAGFSQGQGAYISSGKTGGAQFYGSSGIGTSSLSGSSLLSGGSSVSTGSSAVSGSSILYGSSGYGQTIDTSKHSGYSSLNTLGLGQNYVAGSAGSSQYFNTKSQLDLQQGGSYETSSPASIGQINIVGGGYSAVGGLKSGVQITHHGETAHVTPVPLTPLSSTVSVPVVTSVPIPHLKSSAHSSQLDNYYGGVIANVPELQYKIDASRGFSGYSNYTGFNSFVSSTPSSVLVGGGYNYPKPSVGFVEERVQTAYQNPSVVVPVQPIAVTPQPSVAVSVQPAISLVQPAVSVSKIATTHHQPVVVQPSVESYTVRPSVSFVKQQVQTIQPSVVAYQKPATVVSYKQPAFVGLDYQKPSYSFQNRTFYNAISGGYRYPKPTVAFEDGANVNYDIVGSSTVKPAVLVTSTYKPAVTYIEQHLKPVVSVVEQRLHQPVVTAYKNVDQGYVYNKPAIPFEEKAVSYNTQQKVVSGGGYHYEKPSVVFEEKPLVLSTPKTAVFFQSTPKPVTYVEQKSSVSSYSSFAKTPIVVAEQPVVQTYISSTPRPILVQPKPVAPVISSYSVSSTPQPVVQPVQYYEQRPAAISSFSISSNVPAPKQVVFPTPTPSVVVEQNPVQFYQQKPAVVSSYSFSHVPQVHVQPKPVVQPVVSSYSVSSTPAPSVLIEEKPIVQPVQFYQQKLLQPVVASTPKPAVVSSYSFSSASKNYVQPQVVQPVQYYERKPAVVSSYSYSAPVVEQPLVQTPVSGFSTSSHYNSAVLVEQKSKPLRFYEQKPAIVETYSYAKSPQPVVSSFGISSQPKVELQQQSFVGYEYPKPNVVFEEKPIVSTVKPVVVEQPVVSTYSYQKPSVVFEEKQVVSTIKPVVVKQPAVVSTYSYQKPSVVFEEAPLVSTVKPVLVKQQQPVVSTYSYVKPSVVFEEKQTVSTVRPVVVQKPAVVSTYNYQQRVNGYEYPQPKVVFEEKPLVSTVKPVVVQPAVVSTYSYQKPLEGYTYSKPSVVFGEKQIVSTAKPVVYEQPAVTYQRPVALQKTLIQEGYQYSKPSIKFESKPIKPLQPVVVENYQYQPAVNVQKQTKVDFYGYAYPKPSVPFVETYENRQPVYEEPFVAKKAYVTGYDYRKPSVRFEEGVYLTTPKTVVYETVAPKRTKVRVTPKPTFASTVATVIAAKLRPFTEKFNFYSYDSRLTSSTPKRVGEIYSTTPVVPVEYSTLPPSTSRPIVKYEFGALVDSTPQPDVTSTYQPIIQTQKYVESYVAPQLRVGTSTTTPEPIEITSPSREYLPSTTQTSQAVPRRRPVKVVKLVRPKTIVKVNDFHPLLSAKLGAQCTCVSNTVKLRKKLSQYIDEEFEQPKPIAQAAYLDETAEGVVVENYEYEPKRIGVTSPPEVVIESTTNLAQPAPTPVYSIRKNSRIRPTSTSTTYAYDEVTPAVQIFLKSSTPSTKYLRDEEPSDREIANVVRKGLKLIKSAAKEGAKEALEEDHSFEGSSGFRSRSERLQGTVDCQRAGLFRHPTQCNKFYACRWDCNKKRFTLHVFNCPVHLTFDNNLGACNWPSQGPACFENTLLPNE